MFERDSVAVAMDVPPSSASTAKLTMLPAVTCPAVTSCSNSQLTVVPVAGTVSDGPQVVVVGVAPSAVTTRLEYITSAASLAKVTVYLTTAPSSRYMTLLPSA